MGWPSRGKAGAEQGPSITQAGAEQGPRKGAACNIGLGHVAGCSVVGLPTLHDPKCVSGPSGCRLACLCTSPDATGWEPQVVDWAREYHGTRSGKKLDPRKVHEGRHREIDNMIKPAVFEPTSLEGARQQGLETVYAEWLDDEKPTPEDPDAVRSRLVATEVNNHVREDVTQATTPRDAHKWHFGGPLLKAELKICDFRLNL